MTRPDRTPDALNDKPHTLALSYPGRNRYRKGTHICSCGQRFTGINQFEGHRAEMRRTERVPEAG